MLTHVTLIRARRALRVWYEISARSPDAGGQAVRAGLDAVQLYASALSWADSLQLRAVVDRHVGGLTELEVGVKFKLA